MTFYKEGITINSILNDGTRRNLDQILIGRFGRDCKALNASYVAKGCAFHNSMEG